MIELLQILLQYTAERLIVLAKLIDGKHTKQP